MSYPPIRKAVFPVAGLGTRFLPATKSVPKEMLTVVDRPLIHYAFEEARESGIEEFIFISAHGKDAIEDYFDRDDALEQALSRKNKPDLLSAVRDWLPEPGSVRFVRQQQPLGLGHAIWCARKEVGDEPFAVLLPDDIVMAERPCLAQLIEVYQETGGHVVGVVDIAREDTSRYGILDVTEDSGRKVRARGLVEKPDPAEAPSTVSIFGRYVLQPSVFAKLSEGKRGAGGEIQITDALAADLDSGVPFHGARFSGTRFDCGSKEGFLAANIAFAMRDPEMRMKMPHLLAA